MRAIDTHAHVFSPGDRFAPDARYTPAYAADLADWFAAQQAAGVTHGVLVQPSFLGTDNRRLLAALAAHPQRLRGVAVVEPGIARGTLAQWHATGVRGIRLNLAGGREPPELGGTGWQSLFAEVAALGWHLELHVEGGRLPMLLDRLGARDLPLVIDHFGRPEPGAGLRCKGLAALERRAAAHPVFVKLSAPYRMQDSAAEHARRLLGSLGPERLLWGSDWPWTNFEGRQTYADCRRWLDEWVGDESARQRLLWDTPARLFGFD